MAKEIIYFLVMQTCIYKVLSIYAQPTIQQYLHLTGTPHPTRTITVPATQQSAPPLNIPSTNQPRPATGLTSLSALALPELVARLQQLTAIQQTTTPNHVANQPRPPTGIPSFSALGLPNLVSGLQQLPTQRSADVKLANPSSIDSNLLNNLAIALQLLIVSNILNAPPPVDSPIAKTKEIPACAESNSSPHNSLAQVAMPNSKFVGSSSFSEPNVAQVYKPTRNSMSLMSPYEALGPISPYSDPVLTQRASVNSRQDFQSPYSMMTDKDLFSMNDLY